MSAGKSPLRAVALVAAAALALGAGRGAGAERHISNPIGEAFALIFDSESIRLDIAGDSLEVRGTYVLLCRTSVKESIPLFYPFPDDSLLGSARMISLAFRTGAGGSELGHWERMPLGSGVRWWLPPCKGDSIVAEAVYRQQIKTNYARYVVTTTRTWGRPLRRARFEIHLPPGATPLEFSFPFEPLTAGGDTCYAYEGREFLPDRDIVVRWRR